jgi:hypothetical protein
MKITIFGYNNQALLASFFEHKINVEGEISMPNDIQARLPKGSVLPLTLYSLSLNDVPRNSKCPSRNLCW